MAGKLANSQRRTSLLENDAPPGQGIGDVMSPEGAHLP